jgi:hypothetical protein
VEGFSKSVKLAFMIYRLSCFEVNSLSKQLRINNNVVNVDERIVGLLIEILTHQPKHRSPIIQVIKKSKPANYFGRLLWVIASR